jgi:hypothetical protein
LKPRIITAVILSTAVMLTLGAATRLDPVPLGLFAEFFANDTETGPPAGSLTDTGPSANHLFAAWQGSPPESFSTQWTGVVCPTRSSSARCGTSTRRSRFFSGNADRV